MPCRLPIKSPWLIPIEPEYVQGKRAVLDPNRLLTAAELEARASASYNRLLEDHLIIPRKVA